MSLPADLRRRLGLVGGAAVFLEETEDGVVLRTAAQAVAHAQAIAKRFADGGKHVRVTEFLVDRKRIAASDRIPSRRIGQIQAMTGPQGMGSAPCITVERLCRVAEVNRASFYRQPMTALQQP